MKRNAKMLFFSLFFSLSCIFIIHYAVVGQAVYGDGIYYWAFTRSLYIDNDVNFSNELSHQYNHKSNNQSQHQVQAEPVSPPGNKYPIGAPLSWLPFFAAADSLIILLSPLIHLPKNGYSNLYQLAVGLGNVFFIILGVFFIFKLLLRYKKTQLVLLSVLLMLFGTNVLYYGSIDVINSHPFSFLASSIYVYYWYRTFGKKSKKDWLLIGILLGVLTLTRSQDVVLGFLLIPELYQLIRNNPAYPRAIGSVVLFVSGFFAVVSLQVIVWTMLYGSFFNNPYVVGDQAFDFVHPNSIGVLFNLKTGLLFYTPLYIVSLLGIVIMYKKNKTLALSFLFTFFAQYYLISSWNGWHQGESFGMRMFISLVPVFALGMYEVVLSIRRKFGYKVLYSFVAFFITYNFILIIVYQVFLQGQTIDLGVVTQQRSIQNLENILQLK